MVLWTLFKNPKERQELLAGCYTGLQQNCTCAGTWRGSRCSRFRTRRLAELRCPRHTSERCARYMTKWAPKSRPSRTNQPCSNGTHMRGQMIVLRLAATRPPTRVDRKPCDQCFWC